MFDKSRFVEWMLMATIALLLTGLLAGDAEASSVTLDYSAVVNLPGIETSSQDALRNFHATGKQIALSAMTDASFDYVQAAGAPGAAVEALSEDWIFQVSFALWTPGVEGTVGARGLSTDVSASFIDIMDDSDTLFGFGGAIEFRSGKFGGYLNGYWSMIKVDESTPFGTASITNDLGLVGFGAAYELGRWTMEHTASADHAARDMALYVYAGARFTSVEVEYDFVLLPTIQHEKTWIDPLVGGKVIVPLSHDWSLQFAGEIGGFGAASDLIWGAAGVVSWDFHIKHMPSSLQFGYLAIGDDYTTGSGTDQFIWDTILHGLLINFQLRF